tara:strand:- start:481 stop:609 length:129 start_codon:yes stop_codon:yes gene_type:complete
LITVADATNDGQYTGVFHVVTAGSNGKLFDVKISQISFLTIS